MVGFTGLLRAFNRGKHSQTNGDVEGLRSGYHNKSRGRAAWLNPDNVKTNVIIRSLQLFFLFVSMCITIGLATFQKSNHVGPSSLTVLLLIVIVPSFLMSAILLAVPVIYDRSGGLKSIHQAVTQVRFGIVVSIATCGTLLIFAFTQTISANVKGCKDVTKDPNAEREGYTDKIPGFCTSKRALAAFLWFTLITWCLSAFLVFKQWRSSRSSGIIPPFREPSSATQAGGGNYEDEPFSVANAPYDPPRPNTHMSQIGQSRTSTSFYAGDRQPFDDSLPNGYRPSPVQDPFSDPSPQYSDPYDRIRAQLDLEPNPPQLPPLQGFGRS